MHHIYFGIVRTYINNKCQGLTEQSVDRTIWASHLSLMIYTQITGKYCDWVSTLYQLCCPYPANMSLKFEMTETALKSNMWGNSFNLRKVKIICFALPLCQDCICV